MNTKINLENQIIAEFLGWKINTYISNDYGEWLDEKNMLIVHGRTGGELKFHYSWNWLMPVIEKIQTLTTENDKAISWFHDGYDSIFFRWRFEYSTKDFEQELNVKDSKILTYHKMVILFIDWFNKEYKNV